MKLLLLSLMFFSVPSFSQTHTEYLRTEGVKIREEKMMLSKIADFINRNPRDFKGIAKEYENLAKKYEEIVSDYNKKYLGYLNEAKKNRNLLEVNGLASNAFEALAKADEARSKQFVAIGKAIEANDRKMLSFYEETTAIYKSIVSVSAELTAKTNGGSPKPIANISSARKN